MRFRKPYTHVIDAVFPIAVFFVFAASSLAVLLLAAHIYQDTTQASEDSYTTRTAYAYVSEKIRQGDENGAVQRVVVDGVPCLALNKHSDETGIAYAAYIYAYEGMLKELQIRDELSVDLAAGADIVPIKSFDIKELDHQLFRLDFEAVNGSAWTVYAAERSVQ